MNVQFLTAAFSPFDRCEELITSWTGVPLKVQLSKVTFLWGKVSWQFSKVTPDIARSAPLLKTISKDAPSSARKVTLPSQESVPSTIILQWPLRAMTWHEAPSFPIFRHEPVGIVSWAFSANTNPTDSALLAVEAVGMTRSISFVVV